MNTTNDFKYWKRYLSFRFLTTAIRKKGIFWVVRDLLRVIWIGLRPTLAKIWVMPDNILYREKKQRDVLYAFYDLAVSPPTFDIVAFLVLAELQRKKTGCNWLHIIIVPGPEKGFRKGDLEAYHTTDGMDYDNHTMHWRLRNILVPCCWLIPSCHQITVCTSREEAMVFQASLAKHIFPKGYTVRFPRENYTLGHVNVAASQEVIIPTIQATPQACRFVNDWVQRKAGRRKVITITLRECTYELDRNSNLKTWSVFARSLDPSIYCPVVIRDTEVALKPLPSELDGLIIFPEASWNVELRAALYEMSYLNMSVNSGPFTMCWYNRQARSLMFKVIPSSCARTALWKGYFRQQGLEPGSQLNFTTPLQRLVWEDDRLEVLQEEFRQICDRIEKF